MSSLGKGIIAGYIKDASTKEPLVGVVVYVQNPSVATVSNEAGFYSISLPIGKTTLIFQYLGMRSIEQEIVLFSDGQMNI